MSPGDDILKIQSYGLLDRLLVDKTTKKYLIWGTDAYTSLGSNYERDKEITPSLIAGMNAGVIKTRARKAMEMQNERTRQHAEVFTPLWVCEMMNDHADEVWFGKKEVFFKNGKQTASVKFPKDKTWQQYVDSRRMEITCGEAPYIVSRYDVATGEMIPIKKRIGFLDRKLRVVTENAADEKEWIKWTIRAFQSSYGYEFQGDNVLIARVNLFMTFEEYMAEAFHRDPSKEERRKILNIITWNIWQMDGLTGIIPYCKAEEQNHQMNLNEWLGIENGIANDKEEVNRQPRCRIYDWRAGDSVEYLRLAEGMYR